MYIPTQEERYSKVARITLLLCVIVPAGIVAWFGQVGDILSCACGFLLPLAVPLAHMGFASWAALSLSALLQAGVFFCMTRSRTLTTKGKVTLAITWGMLFALILRLMIAYDAWVAATADQAASAM